MNEFQKIKEGFSSLHLTLDETLEQHYDSHVFRNIIFRDIHDDPRNKYPTAFKLYDDFNFLFVMRYSDFQAFLEAEETAGGYIVEPKAYELPRYVDPSIRGNKDGFLKYVGACLDASAKRSEYERIKKVQTALAFARNYADSLSRVGFIFYNGKKPNAVGDQENKKSISKILDIHKGNVRCVYLCEEKIGYSEVSSYKYYEFSSYNHQEPFDVSHSIFERLSKWFKVRLKDDVIAWINKLSKLHRNNNSSSCCVVDAFDFAKTKKEFVSTRTRKRLYNFFLQVKIDSGINYDIDIYSKSFSLFDFSGYSKPVALGE